MMTPADGTNLFAKFVEAVKDLPAWLFSAIAIASGLLLFVPQINGELPKDYRPWLVIIFVVFIVLATFKWASVAAEIIKAARLEAKSRKRFHLTPIRQHCMWSVAKQPDGSLVTQISADFAVKNYGAASLGLMCARVIRPKIRGEILHDMITVREQRGHMHGTAVGSDYRIASGTVLPARVVVMIRGTPRREENKNLQVTLGITDDEGNEQRVTVSCRGLHPATTNVLPDPIEALHEISDPIEKGVASVLQSEMSRYEKNGRQCGGLGSIYINYRGRDMNQIGGDSWTPNSATNQEIASDPQAAELHSDNLDALLAVHARLTSDSERDRFANALLIRLREDLGYSRVAYIVVLTLWKVGLLNEAFEAALFGLPEEDMSNFGLSNTLMMFNGMLRYRHPDFTGDMLDALDRFIQGSNEHCFRIPQKIAAIRSKRLLQTV